MSETLNNNSETSRTDELVDEVVAGFSCGNDDETDEALLRLGQELGVELETKYEEAFRVSQKGLDFLFGKGKFNLKKEYVEGKIVLPTKEQEKEAKRDGLTLAVVFPGGIERDEFLRIFQDKYKTEFSTDGVKIWDQAEKDLSKTQAVLSPNRPQQSYVFLTSPKTEVNEAQLPTTETTMNKTPEQAENILKKKQTESPHLNLKGLTLPEYLFLEACHYQKDGKHLDEQHWSYLLEERVTDTARALGAGWYPGDRDVRVNSYGFAHSVQGSRFAAVSYPAPSGASA